MKTNVLSALEEEEDEEEDSEDATELEQPASADIVFAPDAAAAEQPKQSEQPDPLKMLSAEAQEAYRKYLAHKAEGGSPYLSSLERKGHGISEEANNELIAARLIRPLRSSDKNPDAFRVAKAGRVE